MLKLVDNPHLNCGDHLVVRVRLPLWVQYNFVDLQMKYKNYILVNKERSITNDEEYKFTLRNPITNQNSTVYVKYYLYHHVYFVGDTIK